MILRIGPANYVQLPDFSQSYNRYSYCLNNPLKYTDPDGEFPVILVAAVIGGAINVAANMDNINSTGDFLAYFGVGAVAGAVGVATGGIGYGAGGILGGITAGSISGAASGFLLGAGNSIVTNGWDMSAALSAGINGMVMGAVTGAVIGGVVGGYSAYKQGNNIWTGKPKDIIPTPKIETETSKILDNEITGSSTINNEGNASKLTPYEKGEIGVQKAMEGFREEGGTILQREVSLNVDGTKIRADFVGIKDDVTYIFEVKNGPYAGFTTNQKIAIPNFLEHHPSFIPYGKNALNVPAFKSFVLQHDPFTGNYKYVIKHYY